MSKRVLITGVNGLLGQALARNLEADHSITGMGIEREAALADREWEYVAGDLTDFGFMDALLRRVKPDVLINAASFTHVDACEKEKALCWDVNVKGVENLAALALQYEAHLIHYSTDYVFDGLKGPYAENAAINPLGYYGKTKMVSEWLLQKESILSTVVRTCVLYGTGNGVKKNFFLWILENLKNGQQIKVVTDQHNNPTLAEDLALGTRLIMGRKASGVYNIAGSQQLNRYEFALEVARIFNFPGDLISPTTSDKLSQAAPRPMLGGLVIQKAQSELGYRPRSIQAALQFLKQKMDMDG